MLHVYLNYPNSRMILHTDPQCASIGMMGKLGQRHIVISAANLNEECSRYGAGRYRFAANKETNDMWLVIDLGGLEKERAIAMEIRARLGTRYKRFREVSVKEHC